MIPERRAPRGPNHGSPHKVRPSRRAIDLKLRVRPYEPMRSSVIGVALVTISPARFSRMVHAHAMIGIGVAAALMAGLKAIVMWFPRERIALVNGYSGSTH